VKFSGIDCRLGDASHRVWQESSFDGFALFLCAFLLRGCSLPGQALCWLTWKGHLLPRGVSGALARFIFFQRGCARMLCLQKKLKDKGLEFY
jgi:hypothetical protein